VAEPAGAGPTRAGRGPAAVGCRRPGAGFTLLEVLVALALLAVALAAALRVAAQSAGDVSYLRERTFAEWVGHNEIERARLARDWPAPGVTRGSALMGGEEWVWERRVTPAGDTDLRRVEVGVRSGRGGEPLASLTGFVRRPPPPPVPGQPAPGAERAP
jgi:general secretion pathway protein I